MKPRANTEQRLVEKLKKITCKNKTRPVEDIHRSMDIVEHVLHEATDLGIAPNVVTWALKYMKQNPKLDISDAMVMALEYWVE
jgi:hypothetical protein